MELFKRTKTGGRNKCKKRIRLSVLLILLVTICIQVLSACSSSSKKTALRVIIIPKFEVGEMSGDFPGEAQLFYEKYCPGCEEIDIPHMPQTAHFYLNDKSGVGILVTDSGKTAAGLSLMAVLSSELYDYSDTRIVSVGCGGGSAGNCTLGDVILVTAACDYDLGQHVDAHEKKSSSHVMWFPDDSYAEYAYKTLNADLCEKTYEMIKDCPLRTTEEAKAVMRENFGDYEEENILPAVRKGTALTGDDFWKGIYGHATADFIADYYGCPDPYSVTEMEEIAVANTAECFDLLDRLISLRVIVNMDVFLNGETPESTWGEYKSFSEKIENENTETLDIFEPAMHNLFDASSIVIDAALNGEL
jgi:purine nucleoside permease